MSVHTMTGDPTQGDIRAAAGVNDTILAIGRVLIALIFVSSGVEKFMDLGVTASRLLASAARAAARQQHDSLHEEREHDRRLILCAAGAGRYSLDGPCIRPE
jgi:uncharacterized membrane protein YphA (DoxX/SURF4 family)